MPKETTVEKRQRATPRVALSLDASKPADQDGRVGADINVIVGQYIRHGTIPAVALSNPLYGDFTAPEDIHSAREAVHAAEERFASLPAAVRSAASNDFEQFINMFDNPAQRDVLVDAGLIVTDQPPTTVPPVVPASVSDAPTESDSDS